jgi:hypothetical protein
LRNDIPVHPHQQKTRRLFFKGTAVSVCQRAPDFTRCAQAEAASSQGCLQKRKHHLLRWCFSGAGDEARTRYLDLGKVALYQMSYARKRKIDYNPAGGICQPLRSAFFSFFSG